MVLAIKNWYGVNLRVYGSIFKIMSTLVLQLKNSFFGVLKYQEVSSAYEKSFGRTNDGPHVDFHKNVNFIPHINSFIYVIIFTFELVNEYLNGIMRIEHFPYLR